MRRNRIGKRMIASGLVRLCRGLLSPPFKRRFIVRYPVDRAVDSRLASREDELTISVISAATLKASGLANDVEHRLMKSIGRVSDPESYLAFLAWDRGDPPRLRGASVLHIPNEVKWHDALPTFAGEARMGMSYVAPGFRGRGYRKAIMQAQFSYCRENALPAWSVIESRNSSSLRSSLGSGASVVATNILIKCGGINMISFSIPLKFFALFYPKVPVSDYAGRLLVAFGGGFGRL